jgi:hypothetical protein
MAPTPDTTRQFEIRVRGANCPLCLEATKERIRAEDGVIAVSSSMSGTCLKVDHHGLARSRLFAILREHLHGWDIALNGETVMVTVTPEVAELHCGH